MRERQADWALGVRAVVREWERKSPARSTNWGTDDCIQLGLDVSKAMYGADLIPEMRGSYSTFRAGYVQMKLGYGSLEAALTRNGAVRIDPVDARLGDLATSTDFFSDAPIIHIYKRQGCRVTFNSGRLVNSVDMPITGAWRI